MTTESEVVINFIFYYVLICYNLHVVIIVAFLFKHVVKLKFRGLALLGHLDKPIDLGHICLFGSW